MRRMDKRGWSGLVFVRYFSLFQSDAMNLRRILTADPSSPITVINVNLRSCRSFKSVAARFYEQLQNPGWWAGNADALQEVLTDLTRGRYLFLIHGCESLSLKNLDLLERVLLRHRDGGVGYGPGAAVFVRLLPD